MVYQNNNNRITPEAKEDRTLKPAATPQNKMINYSPTFNQGNATMWNNTATALASIGKGMVDMDNLWRRQSEENAIKAAWETEMQGGNKSDWKEVCKRIKGAAKFNPYNDNAFRQLQSMDNVRAAYTKFITTPDLDKMDYAKFQQLRSDTAQQLMQAMKEGKLSPADYGDALVQFNGLMGKAEEDYVNANATYRFKRDQTKIASSGAIVMSAEVHENPNGFQSKGAIIKDNLMRTDAQMAELGWSQETRIGVLFAMTKGFLAKDASSVSAADMYEALSDLELDGVKASELIPNYQTEIRQLYREAQKAIYDDTSFELQKMQLEQNIASEKAMVQFMKWRQQNPSASVTDIKNKYWELVNNYGVQGTGAMKLMHNVYSTEQSILNLEQVKSDPTALNNLQWKFAIGDLSTQDLIEAQASGLIAGKDAAPLYANVENRNKKIQSTLDKQVESHCKSFNTDYLTPTKNGKGVYYIKSKDARLKAQQEAAGLVAAYHTAIANGTDPATAYENYNKQMWKLKQGIKAYSDYKAKTGEFTSMISPRITQAQYNSVNEAEDLKAFKKMGIVRYNGVSDKSITIDSKPALKRKIKYSTGEEVEQEHKGFDIGSTRGVLIGRQLFAPMNGKVVYAKPTGTAGNVVIVQCDNGKYIKYMHVKDGSLPAEGTRVLRNDPIARVGATGNVFNKKAGSLHVELYDKQKNWITASQWYQ